MKLQAVAALVLVVLQVSLSIPPPSPSQPQLWVYGTNYSITADGPGPINAFIDGAIALGYTGIVLNDFKFSVLNTEGAPQSFYDNLPPILAHMESRNFSYIITIDPFGYSEGILLGNSNWAEGQKVVGTPYTVTGSMLTLASTYTGITNGGFDSGSAPSTFTGWNTLDPDRCFYDTSVFLGSGASLKITSGTSTNARITQQLSLTPYRQYHMTISIMTDTNYAASQVQAVILDLNRDDTALNYNTLSINANQGWTTYDWSFNSQGDVSNLVLYIGVWGSMTGTIWFDGCAISETGLLNVLRRPGTPLSVYKTGTSNTYTEGQDFEYIVDTNAFQNGQFNLWHTPPTVNLTAGTSMTAGESISIDYYAIHPIEISPSFYQTGACLSEVGIQDYLVTNLQNASALVPPGTGLFLGYDEMRQMGSCALCSTKYPTAGQLLAWHVDQTVQTIKNYARTASSPVYIWNDMFDPNQNAHANYYLVPTTIANSWAGVPCGVNVMNWLKSTPSLNFWAYNMSLPQIVAGYYDSGNGLASAQAELANAKGVPGILGWMYTTFENDYSQLGPYASTILQNWASTISSEGDPNYYANCAISTSTGGSSSSSTSPTTTPLPFWIL